MRLELGRTLHRLLATGLPAGAKWCMGCLRTRRCPLEISSLQRDIVTRVTEGFPAEPVGTLDAIRFATAAIYSRQVTPLTMLGTDEQVRANAHLLGLSVAPD